MQQKVGGGGGRGMVGGWGVGSGVGVGDGVGYGDVNREDIVKCTYRYCTILRIIKKIRGSGEGQYLNPKHSQVI